MKKLNEKALGLSLGITFGAGMLITGLISLTGYGVEIVNLIGTVYKGFKPSILGSLIGGVYGFIDGFIGGYLISWLYNYFS
ncbi:MAG: hypothetical protein CMH64_04600 [Nanoarchaeota archaeon]|nr:hypothetical protein [Nanoarchaeota archaeon]|tara:strand:- start:461 stop:703 length:243 start_codon:yes stop_codon:yes gene_type:complete